MKIFPARKKAIAFAYKTCYNEHSDSCACTRKERNVLEEIFDVAIVGAGASGLVCAWQSAKKGKKVLFSQNRSTKHIQILIRNIFHTKEKQNAKQNGFYNKFFMSAQ